MSTLDSLSTILFTSIGIYTIFLIYLKLSNASTIKDLIPNEKLDEYNKIKSKHMMVFIIGLLLGFVIILIKDNKVIEAVINNKYVKSISSVSVSDVEDISVL